LADEFSPQTILPGDRSATWAAPAPVEPITPPRLDAVALIEGDGERMVRGQLQMNGAYRTTIRVPLDARPLRARVNGVEADFADTGGERRDYMNLACQGRACDGATIEIVVQDQEADADWYVIGQFPGYRSPAAAAFRARRPASATPIQSGDSAVTLTRFRPETMD
jgi:hypothetical protein